jgi:hypothetical protein
MPFGVDAVIIFIAPNNGEVFDVHVTVHRDEFLTIKPTRCTDFSNLLLE